LLLSQEQSVRSRLSSTAGELAAFCLQQPSPPIIKYGLDILGQLAEAPGFPPVWTEPALRFLAVDDAVLSASALEFLLVYFREYPSAIDPSALIPAALGFLSTCESALLAGHFADLITFVVSAVPASASAHIRPIFGMVAARAERDPNDPVIGELLTIVNATIMRVEGCDLGAVCRTALSFKGSANAARALLTAATVCAMTADEFTPFLSATLGVIDDVLTADGPHEAAEALRVLVIVAGRCGVGEAAPVFADRCLEWTCSSLLDGAAPEALHALGALLFLSPGALASQLPAIADVLDSAVDAIRGDPSVEFMSGVVDCCIEFVRAAAEDLRGRALEMAVHLLNGIAPVRQVSEWLLLGAAELVLIIMREFSEEHAHSALRTEQIANMLEIAIREGSQACAQKAEQAMNALRITALH
jgi:hypothetical protein